MVSCLNYKNTYRDLGSVKVCLMSQKGCFSYSFDICRLSSNRWMPDKKFIDDNKQLYNAPAAQVALNDPKQSKYAIFLTSGV